MAFTNEQLEAINKEGSNIIVSAGAGSGKTAVLTQRVIRKLKAGVPIDQLLVLTFTNEAANEMKNRIREAIIKNSLNDQLSLLDSSYITTFDSFALSIVKKYHYLLNITPNVRIIDNNIILIKKYKIIDEIFESMYDEELFDKLINDFCLKDDQSLKNYIINISNKLDLLIDKKTYLSHYLEEFYKSDNLDSLINQYQTLIIKKINELKDTLEELNSYITDNLSKKLDDYFNLLFNGSSYDEFVLFMSQDTVRFVGVSEDGIKKRDQIKQIIADIKKLLRFKDVKDIKESILKTKDYAQVIIKIINILDEQINKYKNKYDIYEFNDIAHKAIQIVKENSDIRDELKNYFNEIMVDEYQDTSDIQEEFINNIANNNVYMVGDIKQSIYRFRNANPYIFQHKYNEYSKENSGIKIDLLKNFRSRNETLQGINEIFNLVMDDEIGNAAYLESHNMIYGNTAYDLENTNVNNNLEIYNYDSNNEEYTSFEQELFIISKDIQEKINNNYQIFDKKSSKLRTIKYSDICIITDRNKYLDKYKKILCYHDIPSVLYKDEDLTNDDDILVLKNLINLVNHVNKNLYDDKFRYLFTSVARSFLFEYSDNQIYDIYKNKSYKTDKITMMCKDIDMVLPLYDIIVMIINNFKVYEKLTILNDIDESLIRISNLLDIANDLSNLSYSISDFIAYLDDINSRDLSVKYSVNTNGENAVKIMNIHKSKGLEFSLCYFTGMSNKFTIRDISEKIIFDKKYGLILPYMEEELKETIVKDLYTNNFFLEEVSEKIRLFYVALTRCREKMIILASLNEENEKYDRLVPCEERIKYRSFLDILNSISIINKYITNKEAICTHDYDRIKLKKINSNNSKMIDKKKISMEYNELTNKHFSKETKKLLDKETIKLMEYGTKVHEELEYASFTDKTNKHVKLLLSKLDNSFINVYKEYEFSYLEDNVKYHGIIDLMLEYKDYINIIDYKLKNINDENYLKQLNGYKEYIKKITSKNVNIYLYSIIDNVLKKID